MENYDPEEICVNCYAKVYAYKSRARFAEGLTAHTSTGINRMVVGGRMWSALNALQRGQSAN